MSTFYHLLVFILIAGASFAAGLLFSFTYWRDEVFIRRKLERETAYLWQENALLKHRARVSEDPGYHLLNFPEPSH